MQTSAAIDTVESFNSNAAQSKAMSVEQSADLLATLSRNLYSDSILATVREVLFNARDAHIRANTKLPVEVTNTTTLLTIQDFGAGIPHEDFENIYGIYGASTKRNDLTQTGGFGLGCKAPFSTTNTFSVRNTHGGKTVVYSLLAADPELGNLPSISVMTTIENSQLPTGLTVIIPAQLENYEHRNSILKNFQQCSDFDIRVNRETIPARIMPPRVDFDYATKTSFWWQYDTVSEVSRIVAVNSHWYARYGGVLYPITKDSLDVEDMIYLPNRLVIDCPPNSLSLVPSREGLKYDFRTKETLNRAVSQIHGYFKDTAKKSKFPDRNLTAAQITKKDRMQRLEKDLDLGEGYVDVMTSMYRVPFAGRDLVYPIEMCPEVPVEYRAELYIDRLEHSANNSDIYNEVKLLCSITACRKWVFPKRIASWMGMHRNRYIRDAMMPKMPPELVDTLGLTYYWRGRNVGKFYLSSSDEQWLQFMILRNIRKIYVERKKFDREIPAGFEGLCIIRPRRKGQLDALEAWTKTRNIELIIQEPIPKPPRKVHTGPRAPTSLTLPLYQACSGNVIYCFPYRGTHERKPAAVNYAYLGDSTANLMHEKVRHWLKETKIDANTATLTVYKNQKGFDAAVKKGALPLIKTINDYNNAALYRQAAKADQGASQMYIQLALGYSTTDNNRGTLYKFLLDRKGVPEKPGFVTQPLVKEYMRTTQTETCREFMKEHMPNHFALLDSFAQMDAVLEKLEYSDIACASVLAKKASSFAWARTGLFHMIPFLKKVKP